MPGNHVGAARKTWRLAGFGVLVTSDSVASAFTALNTRPQASYYNQVEDPPQLVEVGWKSKHF